MCPTTTSQNHVCLTTDHSNEHASPKTATTTAVRTTPPIAGEMIGYGAQRDIFSERPRQCCSLSQRQPVQARPSIENCRGLAGPAAEDGARPCRAWTTLALRQTLLPVKACRAIGRAGGARLSNGGAQKAERDHWRERRQATRHLAFSGHSLALPPASGSMAPDTAGEIEQRTACLQFGCKLRRRR
jgi:hypothetical protein